MRIHWKEHNVSQHNYMPMAANLWSTDYRVTYREGKRDVEVEDYQIIVFKDQPGVYHIRDCRRFDADLYIYTRESCLGEYTDLDEAKTIVEMLLHMGV